MPPKIAHFPGGDPDPSPTRVHIPNDILTGSAALAQLLIVTSRHTDYATSVAIGCSFAVLSRQHVLCHITASMDTCQCKDSCLGAAAL